jgi:hypothetical protein
MTAIGTTTRSLRALRLQASMPRMLAGATVLVLCLAGIRSIVAPARTTVIARRAAERSVDQGAEAFAQTFARAYLTWNNSGSTLGESSALHAFLPSQLDANPGIQPNDTQTVTWSTVVGAQADGDRTLVTVAAQTSAGLMYLSVPVARDSHGFLYVSGYPALVGPPANDSSASPPQQQQVDDQGLRTVVARAVTNYLAGNEANLLADLTPDALVSLPTEHLRVTQTQQPTWVQPGRRVAIQVTATDSRGTQLTLTYEVTVRKLDRWYVQSIEVDPTYDGGST